MTHCRLTALRAGNGKQRGVVLFIALIVLVAMSLAGIAIMRSVDTGSLVSGNIAFRQAALASGDRGVDDAFNWLRNNITTGVLNNNSASDGYFATAIDPPLSSQSGQPDWTLSSVWASAKTVGTDANGNTVSYVIHRMCQSPGAFDNNCAQLRLSGGAAGNGQAVGDVQPEGNSVVFFRVTVRVEGPRSTLTILQSNIGLQLS
jgi:Tfp pilus assembly protein PilX